MRLGPRPAGRRGAAVCGLTGTDASRCALGGRHQVELPMGGRTARRRRRCVVLRTRMAGGRNGRVRSVYPIDDPLHKRLQQSERWVAKRSGRRGECPPGSIGRPDHNLHHRQSVVGRGAPRSGTLRIEGGRGASGRQRQAPGAAPDACATRAPLAHLRLPVHRDVRHPNVERRVLHRPVPPTPGARRGAAARGGGGRATVGRSDARRPRSDAERVAARRAGSAGTRPAAMVHP